MTTGIGTPPAPPLDPVIATDLFNARFEQTHVVSLARTLTPMHTLRSLDGTYPIRDGWRGLDLSMGWDPTQPIGLYDAPPPIRQTLTSGSLTVKRYAAGQFSISNIDAGQHSERGVDVFAMSSDEVRVIAAEAFAYLVFASLGTTGNYASGFATDPGNLTTDSFDLKLSIIKAAEDSLMDVKKLPDNMSGKLIWSIADDLMDDLVSNDQIQNFAAAGFGVVREPNDAVIKGFFEEHSRVPIEVNVVYGVYKNSSGSATDFFSGKIAATVAAPDSAPSFFKMAVPGASGADANAPLFDIRSQPNAAIAGGGWDYFADAHYGINIQDSEAGRLFYSLGS